MAKKKKQAPKHDNPFKNQATQQPEQAVDGDDFFDDISFDENEASEEAVTTEPEVHTPEESPAPAAQPKPEEEEASPVPEVQTPVEEEQKTAPLQITHPVLLFVSLCTAIGRWFYRNIYYFGLRTFRISRKIMRKVFPVIRVPFAWLYVFAKAIFIKIGRSVKGFFGRIGGEIRHVAKEIVHDFKNLPANAKKQGKSIPAMLFRSIRRALHLNKKFWRTVGNIALPVTAFILLLVVLFNQPSDIVYALRVEYNGASVGYITNESVYLQARELAESRLNTADGDQSETQSTVLAGKPTYELTQIERSELTDTGTLCDNLIASSGMNMTNACGIYIDDEFLCSVKNETDAVSVFNSILSKYEAQVKDDENAMVGFVEEIDYRQGFYADNPSTMWDAQELADKLSTKKEAASYYTVQDGDNLYKIARAHGKAEAELKRINPQIGEYVFEGDKVKISQEVDFVRVKVVRTEVRTQSVAYETVKTENAKMYKGEKKTVTKGENGTDRITELVTYVGGVKVSSEVVSRERTKEPVTERIQIGTRVASTSHSYSGTVIEGSTSIGGFRWPAPSCNFVSSPFGYRRTGFHYGVDLVKKGGGAYGTYVVAAKAGTVDVVTSGNSGLGCSVTINHGGGVKTRYGHMVRGSISVKKGEKVKAGQIIGRVGDTGNVTGPHLHFEIVVNGTRVNPMRYISR